MIYNLIRILSSPVYLNCKDDQSENSQIKFRRNMIDRSQRTDFSSYLINYEIPSNLKKLGL